MDPIMKLLEEDEDESMHSGADVEAFTAALNRDIEGGTSICQPSRSKTSAFSQDNNQNSSQMYSQWQPCLQDNTTVNHSQQQELSLQEKQEDQASQLETNEHVPDIEIKQEAYDSHAPQNHQPHNMPIQVDVEGHQVEHIFGQNSESSASDQMQLSGNAHAHAQIPVTDRNSNPSTGSQFENMQRFSGNQPASMTEQAGASTSRQKQISFGNSPGIAHAQIPVTYRSPNPSTGSKLENGQRFVGNQPGPMTDQAGALALRQKQISFGSSPGVGIKKEFQESQAPQHHQPQNMPMQVDGKGHQVEHNSVHSSQSSASAHMQKLGTGHAQISIEDRKPNPTTGSQCTSMQKYSNQSIPMGEQAGGSAPRQKQIPFGILLPSIIPELDKDRAMQLQTLYNKLRRNEIPKETFVRLMRGIVGDQMLRLAVVKMQAKAQNPTQQERPSGPPIGVGGQYVDPNSFGQLHQKNQGTHPVPVTGPSQAPASANQPNTSGHQNIDSSVHRAGELECRTDSQRMHANQMPGRSAVLIQGLTKEQQQHLHFPQSSFPVYGVNTPYSHTTSNISSPSAMVRPQPPVQLHQRSGPAHGDDTSQAVNAMNVSKGERQNSLNDPKSVPAPTTPNMSTASMQQNATSLQPMPSKEQTFTSSTRVANIGNSSSFASLVNADTEMVNQSTSASPMSGIGDNSKISAKRPIIGQKKPLDAHVSSPPLSSKKHKVSGGFADQSIELLNDVTAVSGVNLREEEEQLFSLPKDDNRVSEASRRAVQEEEDRLILQKIPLQKKLAEILTKCGLQTLSNDVQRCLSLCVEERLRALVSSLIRVSKQRADTEKSRHSIVVNSDVREHIMVINRKAREEWDKKQAEAEKLRKQNEPDSSDVADVEREKDEGRAKTLKANKEDDDKMRTTAANVAARAAVGGDDMLSKWQLMAQARQKHDVGSETAFGSQMGKDPNSKGSATLTRNVGDLRVAAKKDQSAAALRRSGAVRQSGRSQVTSPSPTVTPRISVKDVIAVLEREPQMAKSTLLYKLYNRLNADSAT